MSPSIETLIQESKSIGIVSHDAGGANLINSLIKNFPDISFNLFIDGPAFRIFNAINITVIKDEITFLDKIDFLLLGTGASTFEKKMLLKAKIKNITTASILDHFVNFKNRFIHKKKVVYPDYCFVSDEHAYKIAKKELYPYQEIYLCKSYYIESIKSIFKDNINIKSNTVLYILENIKEDWGIHQPWEIAFDNFYVNFFKGNKKIDKIIVRPHPKDDPEIYKKLNLYNEITFDFDLTPYNSLSKVFSVVGAESYFLYVAREAGFDVHTSIPIGIRKPRLPTSIYKTIA